MMLAMIVHALYFLCAVCCILTLLTGYHDYAFRNTGTDSRRITQLVRDGNKIGVPMFTKDWMGVKSP